MKDVVYKEKCLGMLGYERDIELKMQRLFVTLSEKDRRRDAAIEAAKLGPGGIESVSVRFDLDPKTVRRRMTELEQTGDLAPNRVRKRKAGDAKQRLNGGGWRKMSARFSPNSRRAIRCGKECCGATCRAVRSAAVWPSGERWPAGTRSASS